MDVIQIVRPLVAVYVGLYTGIFNEFRVIAELHDFVNAAIECFTAGQVHVYVLRIRGDIGNDENLGIARLTVEIAAGEQERVAVQVVQHVAMFQAAPELLKDEHVLSVVGVEGVTIIFIFSVLLFVFYFLNIERGPFTRNQPKSAYDMPTDISARFRLPKAYLLEFHGSFPAGRVFECKYKLTKNEKS